MLKETLNGFRRSTNCSEFDWSGEEDARAAGGSTRFRSRRRSRSTEGVRGRGGGVNKVELNDSCKCYTIRGM